MTVTRIQKAFAPFKRALPRWLWSPIRAATTALVTPVRFSLRTGHWRSSLRQSSCAANGDPIPWYTYPTVDFLEPRHFADKKILEFGRGQSTLWWGRRAHSVVTIEEDSTWAEKLRAKIGANVAVYHVPADPETRDVSAVIDAIQSTQIKKFDVVVVDGHLREELSSLAFDYLALDGALIVDNSDGYGFYDVVKGKNCRRIDFFGFAPGVSLRHCTSIVFVGDCFLLRPDLPIPVLELGEYSGSDHG